MRAEDVTSVFGGKRNDDIEILRGVAVLFVLGDHLLGFWNIEGVQSALSDYLSLWGGVDLFFAISGFVITRSLLRSMADLHSLQDRVRALVSFWIKRVWRLWPAAWFWLVLPFVVAFVAMPEMRADANLRANVSFLFGGILNVVNIQQWAYCTTRACNRFMPAPTGVSLSKSSSICYARRFFCLRRENGLSRFSCLRSRFNFQLSAMPIATIWRGSSVAMLSRGACCWRYSRRTASS
ncbi:peptidoglycan/LPS O-acetylase OafA/YrhL [Paraburkholderia caledonica]|uniref:Peptidoglycan/LPS O-acetylase OafA/YrhL n=1 Tax=Paraburkholderia caledonica TaxID=134536 RepID=A0ABU1KSC7_9BURK|nr:acyltransferase [Paraburkholderia caledonica]MDR6373862.1 peptidoglycan/LPS O-acetylase OafA/YrhL [Paraburkholderia caledonica]